LTHKKNQHLVKTKENMAIGQICGKC